MYISIIYFPNGFYDGKGNTTGYKQYKLKIYHHLGVNGHDIPFISKEIKATELLTVISMIKEHRDHHIIKTIDKGNNIKEFIIKTVI